MVARQNKIQHLENLSLKKCKNETGHWAVYSKMKLNLIHPYLREKVT